jgi:hypothetical protein
MAAVCVAAISVSNPPLFFALRLLYIDNPAIGSWILPRIPGIPDYLRHGVLSHLFEPSMSATDVPAPSSSPAVPEVTGWHTLRLLRRYHWFVFIVGSMAWTLDCIDQQFFTLSRMKAMTDLLADPASDDPRIAEFARSKFDTVKGTEKSAMFQ